MQYLATVVNDTRITIIPTATKRHGIKRSRP